MAVAKAPASPPAHCFQKRTFHKPVYCHHCTDLLWGIIGQGYTCEVCNFVVHDKCLKTVVSPCSCIAPTLVKVPVAHCWSEPLHLRRRHCNVCRKKLDDTYALKCEVCEYNVHVDCEDFVVPNCKDCATFVPEKSQTQHHHWREGNLPPNSKCVVDKKTCWTGECLAGLRCEWCGYTLHASCVTKVPLGCTFGLLQPIMLPPAAVSIPRTEVPMEAIIGVQNKRKDTMSPRSISEEFTSDSYKLREAVEEPATRERSRDRDERDEEVVKVFDGNSSLQRRMFRLVTVSRAATVTEFLTAAMRAFHLPPLEDAKTFLTDAYSAEETELTDPLPVAKLTRRDGKRPAVFLRYREHGNDEGSLRVYPSRLGASVSQAQTTLTVTSQTTVTDVIAMALQKFNLHDAKPEDYHLVEVMLDKGVSERVMESTERPWDLLKAVARDSVRQMEMTRFYLQLTKDPHGPSLALFVGNLPPNLSQRQYEKILIEVLVGLKYSSIGPIYYEYGSMVLTYEDSDVAVRAFYALRETMHDDKNLLVMLLPTVQPEMIPEGVLPLLVFVNVKSGGCQGLELIHSFRKLLNPYQVFDLDNGGPLPGLYVFRQVKKYKILVCGGDGTIGWVLQCLDNVGQDSECQHPACAIVPLGTGNDLARVLRWGPGYNGGEDPINLLKDVIDAEDIRLDRWTVVFHIDEKVEDKQAQTNSTTGELATRNFSAGSTSEDNTQIFVMNNYFGIGIEAELCLDFHNAREENPNKFNSRLHNKGVYVKMGLRKMVSRKLCKDLHKEIRLEVDGRHVELPPLEGVIILNILSWGSGANPWGPEKDDQFNKPNHWDGHLEVVGVTGIVHLGQIQSGLRSAIRIAQGGHIRIKLNSELPVQVDGEPWNQAPGEVVVLKSALKATMLKKSKIKRRNTEPSLHGSNGDKEPAEQ